MDDLHPVETPAERRAAVGLLVLAALALAIRAAAVAEPLGIDQSLWASAARGMARGQLLYRDLWEQRPPGIYLAYWTAFSVLGWREATIAWLDLAASTGTAILLFAVVRPLGGRLAAAGAAALYAVFTAPAWLYGYGGFLERSVCETFTVGCAALAAWSAVRVREGSRRPFLLAAVLGAAAGVAVVFKPNAGLYLPAVLAWVFAYGPRPITRAVGPAIRFVAVAGAASLVPPLATLAWLASLGVLADARVAILDFNRFYLTSDVTVNAMGVAFAKAVWLRMKTDPLWAAGSFGALATIGTFIRARRLAPLPALAVCWGAAAALVIFVNGIRLFNSYFINALAPLAIMAAWVLAGGRGGPAGRRVAAVAAAVAMVWLLVSRGYVPRVYGAVAADVRALAGVTDRVTYLERFGGYANSRGYSARANDELAKYIAARTHADDRIFLFGINGAGIYFLADRLPAHRFLRVNFFVPDAFPNPAFTREAVVAELGVRRPTYVIFERLHAASEMGRQVDALPQDPAIAGWLTAYTLETTIEDFTVYRLQDAHAPDRAR